MFNLTKFKNTVVNGLLFIFILNTIGPIPNALAQDIFLPHPGQMVGLSPAHQLPVLRGIKLDANYPMRFHFYVDKGSGNSDLTEETNKLVKYFLASLTIPETDLWVNLSPYEKDRIVPKEFGLTQMGRDLLAQDYLLKQITSSLMYPGDGLGKEFWKNVYAQAQQKYGTTQVAFNTFNKVWIVPEKAVVYEHDGSAFILESHLKVMLEQDYVALNKNSPPHSIQGRSSSGGKEEEIGTISSQILRDIIIPALTKEVNEGKNFAQLRQVFYSLILASWYKKKISASTSPSNILAKAYANARKLGGIGYDKEGGSWEVGGGYGRGDGALGENVNNVHPTRNPLPKTITHDAQLTPNKIYQRYLQAFKKGVYNFIQEEPDPATGQTIPRKYFSGGVDAQAVGKVIQRFGANQIPSGTIEKFQGRLEETVIDVAMTTTGDEHDSQHIISEETMNLVHQKTNLLAEDFERVFKKTIWQNGGNALSRLIRTGLYHMSIEVFFMHKNPSEVVERKNNIRLYLAFFKEILKAYEGAPLQAAFKDDVMTLNIEVDNIGNEEEQRRAIALLLGNLFYQRRMDSLDISLVSKQAKDMFEYFKTYEQEVKRLLNLDQAMNVVGGGLTLNKEGLSAAVMMKPLDYAALKRVKTDLESFAVADKIYLAPWRGVVYLVRAIDQISNREGKITPRDVSQIKDELNALSNIVDQIKTIDPGPGVENRAAQLIKNLENIIQSTKEVNVDCPEVLLFWHALRRGNSEEWLKRWDRFVHSFPEVQLTLTRLLGGYDEDKKGYPSIARVSRRGVFKIEQFYDWYRLKLNTGDIQTIKDMFLEPLALLENELSVFARAYPRGDVQLNSVRYLRIKQAFTKALSFIDSFRNADARDIDKMRQDAIKELGVVTQADFLNKDIGDIFQAVYPLLIQKGILTRHGVVQSGYSRALFVFKNEQENRFTASQLTAVDEIINEKYNKGIPRRIKSAERLSGETTIYNDIEKRKWLLKRSNLLLFLSHVEWFDGEVTKRLGILYNDLSKLQTEWDVEMREEMARQGLFIDKIVQLGQRGAVGNVHVNNINGVFVFRDAQVLIRSDQRRIPLLREYREILSSYPRNTYLQAMGLDEFVSFVQDQYLQGHIPFIKNYDLLSRLSVVQQVIDDGGFKITGNPKQDDIICEILWRSGIKPVAGSVGKIIVNEFEAELDGAMMSRAKFIKALRMELGQAPFDSMAVTESRMLAATIFLLTDDMAVGNIDRELAQRVLSQYLRFSAPGALDKYKMHVLNWIIVGYGYNNLSQSVLPQARLSGIKGRSPNEVMARLRYLSLLNAFLDKGYYKGMEGSLQESSNVEMLKIAKYNNMFSKKRASLILSILFNDSVALKYQDFMDVLKGVLRKHARSLSRVGISEQKKIQEKAIIKKMIRLINWMEKNINPNKLPSDKKLDQAGEKLFQMSGILIKDGVYSELMRLLVDLQVYIEAEHDAVIYRAASYDRAMRIDPAKAQKKQINPVRRGGIDLNPSQMTIQVKNEGEAFHFNSTSPELDPTQIVGVTFSVRSMTPVTDVPSVFGLQNKK